jgi:hypothetical protein
MTWTYSGDPAANNRDSVRFLIGDTDTTKQQLTDEEIAFLLTQSGDNVYLAGASACYAIAADYARLVDKEVGDLVIDYSQRVEHYMTLGKQLEKQASKKSTPNIFSAALNTADKNAIDDDTSLVQATFRRDMHSNPNRYVHDDPHEDC